MLVVFLAALLSLAHGAAYPHFLDFKSQPFKVGYDSRAIKLNDERAFFLSGAVHPPRFMGADEWETAFDRLVESGLNMVQVYVFWNHHQPTENEFRWSGNANLTDFVVRAGKKNLFVNLRIGPYVCGEWTYGGIPVWVALKPGMKFRTSNAGWQQEMGKFIAQIVTRLRPQFADRGGPIVLAQIENELHGAPQSYVDWCGSFAMSLSANVPWLMCNGQSSNLTINTCNGKSCTWFAENYGQSGTIQKTQPPLWTENEGGFQTWGENPQHPSVYFWARDPIELASTTMQWFARGGTHMDYYMFAGGNHFAHWGAASLTSYYAISALVCPDLMPHEPTYTHTKQMHLALSSVADILVNNPTQVKKQVVLPWFDSKTNRFENGTDQYAFIYGSSTKFAAFIQNDATIEILTRFKGKNFTLSPSSLMLVDTNLKILYNSGVLPPVTTQRKVIKTEALTFDSSYHEPLVVSPANQPSFNVTGPQEKSPYTLGLTDFLYYSTEFSVPAGSYNLMFTSGPAEAFIVYVDDRYVGTTADVRSAEGPNAPELEPVELSVINFTVTNGPHRLTMLSMNLGYETSIGSGSTPKQIGILSSTVELQKTDKSQTFNIGKATWNMRPFLMGEKGQAYSPDTKLPFKPGVQTGSQIVWIKSSFETPADIADKDKALSFVPLGLTRGVFYVNSFNLGRFWTIQQEGSPLGKLTEEYYHIPKEILAPPGEKNTIIIFENTAVMSTSKASVVEVQVVPMAPQQIHDQMCFQ